MILRPLVLSLVLLSGPALAQHAGHAAPAAAAETPATKALREANAKMHKDMDIKFTGDPDVDFAKSMIAHHVGAVEMAKVQLAHGKDAEMRKLSQEIVAAQEKEIALMKAFLARKGVKP